MRKKSALLHLAFVVYTFTASAQTNDINLLVRADDIGITHATNLACIDVYKNGIARSVEVIVPSPWFTEAVKMLNDNPGYDVGVHLCLTSEWTNIKWRPLTHAKTLTDTNGYFFPFIWPNDKFPKGSFLKEQNIDLKEAEAELRAQIEMAKKHIKNLSHLSAHMGCSHTSPEITEIVNKLSKEYQLPIEVNTTAKFPFEGGKKSKKEKEEALVKALDNLQPGNYMLVTHPCLNHTEMESVSHPGYETVGQDREADWYMLTSPKAKSVIKKKNIKLVNYRDLSKQ